MKDAKVINCKSLGIRVDPTITEYADDVCEIVKAGTHLLADADTPVYSWDDKLFYPVELENGKKGYAIASCLEFTTSKVATGLKRIVEEVKHNVTGRR